MRLDASIGKLIHSKKIPVIDAKIKELLSKLSNNEKAAARLIMTGDSKDARHFS